MVTLTKTFNKINIFSIPDSILAFVPSDYARRNLVIQISQDDIILTCITTDHTSQKIKNELSFMPRYTVEFQPVEHDEIIELLSRYYGEIVRDNYSDTNSNSKISVI